MNTISAADTPYVDDQGSTLLDLARFLQQGGADAKLELDELRSKAAGELQRYGQDLGSHLAVRQISIPPAVQLTMSADGSRVLVDNDHPQKAEIESFLQAESRLVKWFKEIEVLHEILRRVELRRTQGADEIRQEHFCIGLTSIGCIAFFVGK
ncbi:hypothetical protein [Chitinilyticum piscinae]|uniref:Uncharacterized protein n=1 Tax=Chitinilyticum piscinae TaxID=2866724 RepID=A0A8J7FZR8_9NEIS|nr:hypothetical protein [Chitinilyticum piscinae]MBE9608708.1 hypothetical protein [Chitinilyticum piscinae]